jgi:ketosteroid isomerase-like protein
MSTAESLSRWHAVLRARDEDSLPDLVAEDAEFRSPALFQPVEGRDAVVGYLTAAMRVLGTDAFAYHREWRNDTGAILEFTTMLDGREVHGVDMIEWNADGRIQRFDVMIRPQSALTKVIEHMAAELMRMLDS